MHLNIARAAVAALTTAFATFGAQSASFEATTLLGLSPGSAIANYTTLDAPGLQLIVTEIDAAPGGGTMIGSDLVGYEGLWLGSDGTGGDYQLRFTQPLSSLSLHVIALTYEEDLTPESLGGFTTVAASSTNFFSADGSAIWDGSNVVAIEDDSRGVISFEALSGGNFTSLRFLHLQPQALNGFVIERIEFSVSAVPEPSASVMLVLGLAGMARIHQRRRKRVGASNHKEDATRLR